MTISRATGSDLAKIQSLLESCDLPFADLKATHLDHFFLSAEGGQLAATIGLEPCGSAGLLRSLAVTSLHRGKGLGCQLVARAEEHARMLRLEALFLLTTTAEGFFSALDYQVINRAAAPFPIQQTSEFSTICPSNSVCMFKRLAAR